LKAIAVRGTMKPKPADESALREAVKKAMNKIKKSPVTSQALPAYGTAVLVNIINKHGIFPTRNFQTGDSQELRRLVERMAETILVKEKVREEAC